MLVQTFLPHKIKEEKERKKEEIKKPNVKPLCDKNKNDN